MKTISRLPDLLLPFGVAPGGRLVHAREADRGTAYSCPDCKGGLDLHRGEKLRPHFAHSGQRCPSSESVEHQAAKMLARQSLEDNARAPASILSMQLNCTWCRCAFDMPLPPAAVHLAELERRVGDFIGDVVGLRRPGPDAPAGTDDLVALVVEVFHTHEVGEDKARRLGFPWVELRADDLLSQFERNPGGPFSWRPIAYGGFKAVRCPGCRRWEKKVHEVAQSFNLPCDGVARRTEVGKAAYLCALETCWSCQQEVPVYWWEGAPFAEAPPPQPRPRTVSFRSSKSFGGKYWMNCCAQCGAPQGDNFLYRLERKPLGDMPQRDISNITPPAKQVSLADRFMDRFFPR